MRVTKDNLVMLGILLAITAAFFLAVYRAQSGQLESVKIAVAERKRQLEAAGLKASRVPPMMREIEQMKQRYSKNWDRRLPHRQELAGFLKEIAGNLAGEHLANTITRPGAPTRGRLYNCLPINMQFEGDFLSLVGFLKRVDAMARLTRIEQLTIDPRRDDPNHALSMVMGMNIYFTEQ